MSKENKVKITQGHEKINLYINKLIRNKVFLEDLKLIDESNFDAQISYENLSKEQREKSDNDVNQFIKISDEYVALKERCENLFKEKYWKFQEKLTHEYGIDLNLLSYVRCHIDNNHKNTILFDVYAEMCRIVNDFDEQFIPFNPGDDFIHLMPAKRSELIAYPVSIKIHSLASKRDVLDFIEKRWPWIDNELRQTKDARALKIKRKRKYGQDLLDFIWNNKDLPIKIIKTKLDKEFPKNGLVYYEISNLIQSQKIERLLE